VVQGIDSLPDAPVTRSTATDPVRWRAFLWHPPRWPGPRPVLPDLEQLRSWPGWIDVAWVVLWILGLAGILIFERWEAIPFHLIWITFALLYSLQIRTTGATVWVLAGMVTTTFAAIGFDVLRGLQPADELTEVPLMAAMFWVMVWHGRRHQAANAEGARVSEENARLLATQSRFLQDASHQLRTPITIALGHSELLARHLADNQDKRDIDVVVGELNRLRLLSERLLLIASSANPDFLQPEPVELDEFVTDALWRWKPTADRCWQVGELDEASVLADGERLGMAFDALLENAVQHTRPGDFIRLSVTRDDRSGQARLIVEDSGSGISRADLTHIFERFATGSHFTGRRGTGLGLALASAVAEGHGGAITARSALGRGSRFEVTLPLPTSQGRAGQAAADPMRTDPMRTDPMRTDPMRTDPLHADAVRTDPMIPDPRHADPVRVDPLRADPLRGGR
jgi:signal transduction histidine kinase